MTFSIGRRGLAFGAAAAALSTGAVSGRAQAQATTQMSIATGTTGGVYYPLGGALANYLSRGIPGMSATAEVTGGSVANFQLLGAGRAGMVFGQVDAAVDGITGAGPFRGRAVPARASCYGPISHRHLDSCQVRHRTSTYDVVRTPYDIVRHTYDVGFNIARTISYVRYYIRYCTYDIVRLSTS